jgi:hypothetical protein
MKIHGLKLIILASLSFGISESSRYCFAADWFVRSGCGSNGDGSSSVCGSAWNSFANILWSSVKPGDTLYVIGSFNADLDIKSAGNVAAKITIRGDYPAGSGQIGSESSAQRICVNNYNTISRMKVYGTISYCVDNYYNGNIQFIAASNEIRDYSKGLISGGFTSADQFICRGGDTNKNFHVFGIASDPTDQGAYERMYVNTPAEGAMWIMLDEGPVSKWLYKFKKFTNVTVDHCKVIAISDSWTDPLNLGGISNLTISNTEVDGGGYNTNGALYIDNNDAWIRPSSVTVQNNYIHDIGSTADFDADAHCIGLQSVNGITITNNHLEHCAAGIVIYPGPTVQQSISNMEISWNLIERMDTALHPEQFPGCGIMFSGVDQCPLCDPPLVAYNIISTPLNCSQSNSWTCVGIGGKWSVQCRFYNNTMIANDYNFAFDGGTGDSVDLRNNISVNPNAYHIALYPASPGTWTEDYNIYYPDTGTKFLFGSNGFNNYAGYIANHPSHISCSNCKTSNPLVKANNTLANGSPAIDAGTAIAGLTTDYFGNPVPHGLYPDIGACEYSQNTALMGDINIDGVVDIRDLQLCVNVISCVESNAKIKLRSDLNENGNTDYQDLELLVNIILKNK